MARKYDWGDGNGAIHSIPLQQHMNNTTGVAQQAARDEQAARNQAINAQLQAHKTAPQAGGAPAAGGAAAGHSGPAPFIPDAQYLAEAAQRQAGRQTAIDNYNLQGRQDADNRDEAIRRLLERIGGDQTQIKQGANRQGLLYSSTLTHNLADYDKNVTQAKGDFEHDYQQREDARAAARKAIEQGAPLEEAAALAAATTRQVAGDAAAAANNALVENAAAPSAAAGNVRTNSKTGQQYTVQAAQGGTWHIYAGGRKVWVPARR